MRQRAPKSTWYDQLVGMMALSLMNVPLDVMSDGSPRSNRMTMCAGLLDSADLGSEGGPHRGGEGITGEQCQHGAQRHGRTYDWKSLFFI